LADQACAGQDAFRWELRLGAGQRDDSADRRDHQIHRDEVYRDALVPVHCPAAGAWAVRGAGRLGDLAEAGHDCRKAKVRDFPWAPGAKAGLDVEERVPQRRDAQRSADLVAKGQKGEEVAVCRPFAMARESGVKADQPAARRVSPLQAALPAREQAGRQALQELARRLEPELRQLVSALRESQPELARRAELASRQEVEQALRLAFLTQLSLRHPWHLFQLWLLLRRRLLPAPDPELRREL